MSIAIIIPVLNEAANLPRFATDLQQLHPAPQAVIVVDAGSHDDSVMLAQALGLQVVVSARGRAVQMNAGAQHTQTDWLLFLHADSRLPPDALAQIQRLPTTAHWGRFDVRLDAAQPIYRLIESLINLRSRYSKIATGDQAIFIRRRLFEQIGGYRIQPLMEDVELCKQLKRQQLAPVCLRSIVTTSARRWQHYGVWRTIWLMWRLRFLYSCGVSAERLAAQYRQG